MAITFDPMIMTIQNTKGLCIKGEARIKYRGYSLVLNTEAMDADLTILGPYGNFLESFTACPVTIENIAAAAKHIDDILDARSKLVVNKPPFGRVFP